MASLTPGPIAHINLTYLGVSAPLWLIRFSVTHLWFTTGNSTKLARLDE
jgi:hypothetical protein